jgi:hypothetical protein
MKFLKYWKKESFEIASYRHSLKNRINKIFNKTGLDQSEKCIYTYNSLGFRGEEPTKEGFKIMSIGCSLTEGVGVNDDETWPYQFTNLIPNGVNINFGTGGRSNDFIVRCLLTYYDFIKPDLVLIMYTHPYRREIYTFEGGIEPFMPTKSWGFLKETAEGIKTQEYLTYLQNDNEDFINWYKNHLLIKYFLESKKSNWLWNGFFQIPKDYDEFNRFDGDYGKYLDFGTDGVHPGPIHNKKYATNLYNHINLKFPNYLEKSTNFLNKII